MVDMMKSWQSIFSESSLERLAAAKFNIFANVRSMLPCVPFFSGSQIAILSRLFFRWALIQRLTFRWFLCTQLPTINLSSEAFQSMDSTVLQYISSSLVSTETSKYVYSNFVIESVRLQETNIGQCRSPRVLFVSEQRYTSMASEYEKSTWWRSFEKSLSMHRHYIATLRHRRWHKNPRIL